VDHIRESREGIAGRHRHGGRRLRLQLISRNLEAAAIDMRRIPRHLSRSPPWRPVADVRRRRGRAARRPRRLFWSSYKGGGMDITGESVLVRKKFSETLRGRGELLRRQGERRIDRRPEPGQRHQGRAQAKSVSVDYIHDKTQYNLSYTNSTERDYISNTTHFSLSQDMFGDLTTVTLGFTDSRDKVGENNGTASKPVISGWDMRRAAATRAACRRSSPRT
jgi:hypothetical protein